MRKLLYILTLAFLTLTCKSQTFIEMMSPEDADVVLIQVTDSSKADIIICITQDKKQAQEWNCIWLFKEWGFSNFSIFIASDSTQLIMKPNEAYNEEEYMIKPHGTVYLTNDPLEARYRDPNFRLPGVMRVMKYKKK